MTQGKDERWEIAKSVFWLVVVLLFVGVFIAEVVASILDILNLLGVTPQLSVSHST